MACWSWKTTGIGSACEQQHGSFIRLRSSATIEYCKIYGHDKINFWRKFPFLPNYFGAWILHTPIFIQFEDDSNITQLCLFLLNTAYSRWVIRNKKWKNIRVCTLIIKILMNVRKGHCNKISFLRHENKKLFSELSSDKTSPLKRTKVYRITCFT